TVAALAGATFLAVSPVFWFNSSILEVYSLNALLLGMALLLLWEWSSRYAATRDDLPLYLAFLVIGLSLAHHRLSVLALPGIVVFLFLVDHSFLRNWKRLLGLFLLILPGLALYAYVPLRLLPAGSSLSYAVQDIILGGEYATSLRLYPDPLQVLAHIPAENFHAGLALAAVGIPALWRRNRNFDVLLALILVADVVFALFYTVPDVEVFLTPSFLVFAIWISAGAGWVIDLIRGRLQPRAGFAAAVLFAIPLLLASLYGLTRIGTVQARVSAESGNEEERARSILASNLPTGALLELDWETATAVRYLQTVEKSRPDLEARLIRVGDHKEYSWILANVDAGRPVYLEQGVRWVRARSGYRLVPSPLNLSRIEPVKMLAEKPGGVISDRVSLSGYSTTGGGLVLFWDVKGRIERDLATFVHYYSLEGKPLGQEDHGGCCEALYGYKTSEWEPGSKVAEAFRAPPPGADYASMGMYSLSGDDLEPYGQRVFVQLNPLTVARNAQSLNVGLGPAILASGYELSRSSESLKLRIYWKATGRAERDYKVFVHLLDATGKIVDQADHKPVENVYPTQSWLPGQTVRDPYTLRADPKGTLIEFGMYGSDGKRLARADGRGDTITIPVQ
ncbi:MAG: protein O-mannosyl-transferase family, partial [Rudaea sp.]